MKPSLTVLRSVFAVAAAFLFSDCAKHSKAPQHDGKAAIAQGPGSGIGAGRSAGHVKSPEREVPGLAPIVQAPGRNDEAMRRPVR
jgi:hypothetical protein